MKTLFTRLPKPFMKICRFSMPFTRLPVSWLWIKALAGLPMPPASRGSKILSGSRSDNPGPPDATIILSRSIFRQCAEDGLRSLCLSSGVSLGKNSVSVQSEDQNRNNDLLYRSPGFSVAYLFQFIWCIIQTFGKIRCTFLVSLSFVPSFYPFRKKGAV